MARIEFAGHRFTLHPEGALYWHRESMLVVADLHLEKGSHFTMRGRFLPQDDSRETLERLARAIKETCASRILFLGDGFHDADGHERLGWAEQDFLENVCGSLQAIWVQGGHGGAFVPSRARQCDVFNLGGLTFRHRATLNGQAEVSGHFHPCARIARDGETVSKRCFVQGDGKLILPSFGSFSDGLDVRHSSVAALFPDGYSVHLLDLEKIHTLAGDRLAA